MTKQDLETLYQSIADHIVAGLLEKNKWTRAKLVIEAGDGWVDVKPVFEAAEGADEESFDPDAYELAKCFRDLRQELAAAKEPFTGAVFTLESDGEFDLQLSYG